VKNTVAPVRSISLAIVVAALVGTPIRSANAQWRAAEVADSLHSLGWPEVYFDGFDGATQAAGLKPLRTVKLLRGHREVRIWTQVELGIPKELYRFSDRGGAVDGELILYWSVSPPDSLLGEKPGETSHDLMLYRLKGQCSLISVVQDTGICRAHFTKRPDWRAILRSAESHGLWSIPDPSALPEDGIEMLDGWTIVVELRDDRGYRTYRYNTPDAHPAWPSAGQVSRVASTVAASQSLMTASEVVRVYRGMTTGGYRTAFKPCNEAAEHDFYGDLPSLAKHGSAEVLAAYDSAFSRGTSQFYLEVVGELTPIWLARRWGSKYERALQVTKLRLVRPWTGTECNNVRTK